MNLDKTIKYQGAQLLHGFALLTSPCVTTLIEIILRKLIVAQADVVLSLFKTFRVN